MYYVSITDSNFKTAVGIFEPIGNLALNFEQSVTQ